ncbi:MAG: hypothetical protein K6T65_12145 [Peptococcaceae bacterium]|nr:hypothetical protein [Peptococcaceae bacterium]
MVRKQVYIKPEQEVLLKRQAKRLGVTEAELIRRAISAHFQRGLVHGQDPRGWEEEKQFIKSLIRAGRVSGKRAWNREELYDR